MTGDDNTRRSALFALGGLDTPNRRSSFLEGLSLPTATVPFSGLSAARILGAQSHSASAEWEQRIETWSADPSTSEQARIDRTLNMVSDAIAENAELAVLRPRVFVQGSYRNQTNVRLESDIDICVLFDQTEHYRVAAGTYRQYGGAPEHTAQSLKAKLHTALDAKFDAVTPGQKAFQIQPSTARVYADVVSAVVYKYHYTHNGQLRHITGTAILDGNQFRTNFPDEHFIQANAKELATAGVYKKMVRFFKRLNLELAGVEYTPLPSFYVESLVWNCDAGCFLQASHYAVASDILRAIESAANAPIASGWWEANGMKFLWNANCVHGGGQFAATDALRFVAAAKAKLGLV